MQPKGSSKLSQEAASGSYPEPDQLNPLPPILLI